MVEGYVNIELDEICPGAILMFTGTPVAMFMDNPWVEFALTQMLVVPRLEETPILVEVEVTFDIKGMKLEQSAGVL